MHKTQLRTSQLGAAGLEITRVGFGARAIGGGWEFGWGPQQDEEPVAAIHRAAELGISWIDTAAAYGSGRSERVAGRALEGLAERPYLFTKASLLDDAWRPPQPAPPQDPARQQATLRPRHRRAAHPGRPRARPPAPHTLRPATPRPGTRDLPPRDRTRRDPPPTPKPTSRSTSSTTRPATAWPWPSQRPVRPPRHRHHLNGIAPPAPPAATAPAG